MREFLGKINVWTEHAFDEAVQKGVD